MRIVIAKDYEDLSRKAAHVIAGQLIMRPDTVLGLATGATPLRCYELLTHMAEEKLVSFRQCKIFNLDEYYSLSPENPQSYGYFMKQHLFSRVDILPENTFIPNGLAENIAQECQAYEDLIRRAGGIDLQLLGIGRNGHIGFNEPDVSFEAFTHLVALDQDTIQANSKFFNTREEVPKTAISMGIKTIMQARGILLLASGAEKAETVYQMVYGKISPDVPASVLQIHPNATVLVDEAAGQRLQEMQNKVL